MASDPKEHLTDRAKEHLEPIFTTSESQQLHLYSLVLSAAGISHNIANGDRGGWQIRVALHDRTRALNEIHTYEEENRNWPLQPAKTDAFLPFFRAQSFLIALSLLLFHSVTGPWTPHSSWFLEGSANSSEILGNGEYFRLITALTLHADLVHLLGNCFLGGFLMHFYFLLLGNGIGLFTLTVTAVLANFINVIAHGPGYISVGFSTAVFSVIGILSALNYRHYKFTKPGRLLLPLMAGAAMLAMLGSGGERTDLGAHFFGLLAGLGAGTVLGLNAIFRLRHNSSLQFLLTITSLILPVLGWYIALH